MVILKDDSYDVFIGGGCGFLKKKFCIGCNCSYFLFCVDFIIPMVLAF